MRPIWLIALNFLRENRWAILLLVLWAVISGVAGAYSIKQDPEDALFLLKQQAVYGVVFTAFLAASAIYNQRRSRRILSVMAKAISRSQYLAGLQLGFLIASALYCVVLAVLGGWMVAGAGASVARILPVATMVFAASVLAGSVSLLFSTFLSPMFAVALTAVVLGINGILAHQWPRLFAQIMPAYTLIETIIGFSFESWNPAWAASGWALVESLILLAFSAFIFSYRDLAVAVE